MTSVCVVNKKKNISLATVIKTVAVKLQQDFSITAGGSVAFDFLFSEDLLSTALTPIRRLTFPQW